ncbi:hypothetical protein FIBSPDRAFT_884696 [Athelia psychrophila]|uniref:Uncharacterized protein n=1 Tax=Athelia psychrophila TaxID=1759441 RepID=A0A166SNK9_9AGAM|nr:hypothetical protein FIBSPDRAFT_884696 [Fibularhizoctonia sp. CBS 109695]
MSQMSPDYNQAAAVDVSGIWITRYVGFSAFTILIWDHVKYIWKRPKAPVIYLFFINRYLLPLSFVVNLVAYTLPSWGPKSCENYVRYEGVMTALGIEIVGLMMLIRIYVLYERSLWIAGGVAFILLAETVTNVWLLVNASAVPHWDVANQGPSYQIHSCSMIFGGGHAAAPASAWLPLLYETIVFNLTLYKTLTSLIGCTPGYLLRTIRRDNWKLTVRETLRKLRSGQPGSILRIICRDGLLYYASARVGIQNVVAQFELLITITMMSRITLSLKRNGNSEDAYDSDGIPLSTRKRPRSFSFSPRGGRGRLPDTQFWIPPALSPNYSEPGSGIQTPEAEDALNHTRDILTAELHGQLELQKLSPVADRQLRHVGMNQPCINTLPKLQCICVFCSRAS